MRKTEFLKTVDEGLKRGKCFMVLKVKHEDYELPQIIIDPTEDIYAKLNYYDSHYDDDMTMILAKSGKKVIQVVDVLMTSNLNDLNRFAYKGGKKYAD